LNEAASTVPLICPDQATEVDVQLPATSDPDWARTIPTCALALLDDAIVPFHVPAMFTGVPTDVADGAVALPPHAAMLTTKRTISGTRMSNVCRRSRFC